MYFMQAFVYFINMYFMQEINKSLHEVHVAKINQSLSRACIVHLVIKKTIGPM
jgi:hypothetical protein